LATISCRFYIHQATAQWELWDLSAMSDGALISECALFSRLPDGSSPPRPAVASGASLTTVVGIGAL